MNLKGFFKECHEKEVFKMLSIYVVSSWVILQVLALIAEPLNFPEKSLTYLILILIIGFPIHVYLIWKFRLKILEKSQTGDDAVKIYKSPFHRMYFSALLIIISISAFSAIVIINTNIISENNFENKSVALNSNDKIAVLQFDNFTGDPKLDLIGDMAANWIIHGITENEVAQVISPDVVNDYTSIIKSQAGTMANAKDLLKTYFKPGKIISGGFYKEKNKLLLQGTITDGLINKTFISFETIECDQDSPLDCIEELKQKVLGYLIISEDDKNLEETPPKFQAYQYLLSADNHLRNDSIHFDYLNKAIKADPNYFEPKIKLISFYINKGKYWNADSLITLIDINSKLSSRQKNYLFYHESLLKGRYDKTYNALKKEYEIAYKDIATNQSLMVVALQFVNRPKDIDDIYKEIPMGGMNLYNCYNCGNRYYIKGLADIELKKYKQVIDSLLPITKIIEGGYLKKPLIMAYVRSGDYNALNEQFKLWELSMDKNELFSLYIFVGNEFLLANQKNNANTFFSNVLSSPESVKDQVAIANANYYSQDYKTAQNLLEQIHTIDPKNIEVIVKLAISNYKNGNLPKADDYIKSLDALRTDYQFGRVDYGYAQYYAAINDKGNTFKYLLKAVASGWWFTTTTFQNDPHFNIYRDTQEFKDVLNYWNQFLEVQKTDIQ